MALCNLANSPYNRVNQIHGENCSHDRFDP
jgi:hypothetical protein